MAIDIKNKITLTAYLPLISLSFMVIGWLLNGYLAPKFVLTVTTVIICYIIRVGTGAIALASIWIVGLMSVGAVRQLWFHGIPRPDFKLIPLTFLVCWLFALATVWWLGKVSDYLRQNDNSNKWLFFFLICSVLVSLAGGWQLYNHTLLYF